MARNRTRLNSRGIQAVLKSPRMAAAVRDLPVHWVDVDEAVAEDAGWIRGRSAADLGDALHIASAARSGASVFLTNDRDIHSTGALAVAYLDDLLSA